jgi:DNA-directed RNA polymerase specialized sigma24 family protein
MPVVEQQGLTNEDFAALFDRFFASVYDLALRVLGRPEEAAAAVERTFARARSELERQSVEGGKPWLYGLAAAELPRKRVAHLPDDPAFARIEPDRLANPDAVLHDPQLVDAVWSTAAGLSVNDYLLLDLQLRHGLQDAELARALRSDAKSVERRLAGLREQLEEAVESRVSPMAVFAALAKVPPPPGLQEKVWARLQDAAGIRPVRRPPSVLRGKVVVVVALGAALFVAAAAGAFFVARGGPGVHDPTAVRSSTHQPEKGSSNPDVTVTWQPSSDANGYSVSWTTEPETPDKSVDLPGTATRATGHLKPGTSWFNLRTVGQNGSWTSTVHLGPFLILPDTQVPDTTVDQGPGRFSKTSVTFEFSSNERAADLQCSLDRIPFSPCTSPQDYTGLEEGEHVFRVRAVDAGGNVDPTPARHKWRVDSREPETVLTESPKHRAMDSARFAFQSTERGSTFECRFDGGVYKLCKSPKWFASLDDGVHRFRVRAVDRAGNVDRKPVGWRWTVDTDPPETKIESGPPDLSHEPTATFTLSSEAGATFECRLDRHAWGDCTAISDLKEGRHRFRARAKDEAGNVDPTPARWAWEVDLPPQTAITAGPKGPTSATSATFRFSSTESPATFQCKLDSKDWVACSSPKSYSGLSQGAHTFRVRARDEKGNVDETPAARSWRVDTVDPRTSITSGPKASTGSNSASFTFTSSESGVRFQCRLDGAAWRLCASPKKYTGLANGPHVFAVRAVDRAGNRDSSPDTWNWVVH